jgi:hypothetical protein
MPAPANQIVIFVAYGSVRVEVLDTTVSCANSWMKAYIDAGLLLSVLVYA